MQATGYSSLTQNLQPSTSSVYQELLMQHTVSLAASTNETLRTYLCSNYPTIQKIMKGQLLALAITMAPAARAPKQVTAECSCVVQFPVISQAQVLVLHHQGDIQSSFTEFTWGLAEHESHGR
jgi:hypothetical protein